MMGMGGQMMQQMPAPALAVAGGYVFVVLGDTLYQFTVDGLKPVARVRLTPPGRGNSQERQPSVPTETFSFD